MKRILIVDDDNASVSLFKALLEGPEYQVRYVRTGLEAIDECTRARPDLILLDLRIPEMDGFDLARRLKADRCTQDIPLMAITAYGDEYASDAQHFGFDLYMAKPISGTALREAVAALCQRDARE